MSYAANPNKTKKTQEESEAAEALRRKQQERGRIRRLIITLGDDNKKVVGQIKGLIGALEDDVEPHGELIRQTVLDCAQNLPFKTGIFAFWLTGMFDKHATWTNSVIAYVLEELRSAIRAGRFLPAQLLMRFLVSLGNNGLVSLSEVLQLLQEVLALSQGLRPSKGGDLGVFLALAALPFLSPAAYALISEKVDGLVGTAATYLSARDPKWKPLLRVLKNDTPKDHLEAIASMLESLKRVGWAAESIFHVKGGAEPRLDAKANEAPKFTPLGVTAEEVKKSKVRLQLPLQACRFISAKMEADGAESLPEHDRWFLEDYILNTIEAFARDIDECSKQLLRLPFMHTLFEATLVETIFCQMLRLPSPPFLPLFYSRLLQALAEKEQAMLEVVNRGFKALFEHLADLDEECLDVLAEAWSYHLINQSYKADWSPFTGENVAPQTRRFLRRVLERLQRLSFHQNLLHRLPEGVHACIPPEPLPASDLAAQAKPEYTRMLGFVRIKEPQEEVVLKYCERLLKLKAKAEQVGDESGDNADEANAVDAGEDAGDFGAAEEPPDGEDEEAKRAAKRAKLDEEVSVQPSDKPAEASGSAGVQGDGATETPKATEPEKKRQRVEVKEEVKQEDRKEEPGSQAKKEIVEHDFGDEPLEAWPAQAVAELLGLAVLHHGAKTPTHMSKILDGHQEALMKLRPSDEDQAHEYVKAIVRSVFGFWRLSGQRLEITLETLLHRGIVTPRAVVEHALGERTPEASDWVSSWNMINSVARRSLERTQAIRVELAVAKKLQKDDVLEKSRKQLEAAIHETAELFTLIFTELVRSHQDWEDKDSFLQHIAIQRVLMIGRKYHGFIKPLIESAESRIPGVAHNPDIAAVFQSLRAL